MLLLLPAVLAAGLLAAASALASSPIDAKKAEAQQVYGEIIQLDQSLSQADERINLANLQLAEVASQQRLNRHELAIARENLGRSRAMVAKRVVALYTAAEPTTLDLILGASTLGELVSRLNDADRLSAIDRQVIGEVTTFKTEVQRHALQLAVEHADATRLIAQRRAERAAVAAQLGERQQLLNSIKSEIATLEAQQRARELQAVRAAQAAAAAAPASPAVSAPASPSSIPSSPSVIPASPYGGQVVSIAMSYIGTPYVWGGAAPGGFDCSGLVMYSFAQLGVQLPHSSYAMWNYGVSVPENQLQPGDLVFFNGLGHVGMYIGGGDYVEAPHTGASVQVSSLAGSGNSYVGARRILGG